MTSEELLHRLGLRHKPTFRKNHLLPALQARLIEMTEPTSPRSPTQRYRLTPKLSQPAHPITGNDPA